MDSAVTSPSFAPREKKLVAKQMFLARHRSASSWLLLLLADRRLNSLSLSARYILVGGELYCSVWWWVVGLEAKVYRIVRGIRRP
jgi:hypothetical protein